jgi:predicted nucleotidyltransferase
MINKIVKDIETLFKKDLVSIVLFGSYAAARQKDTSDIDLLVVADNIPPGRKERLSLVLSISRKYMLQGKTVSILLRSQEDILNGFEYYNPLLLSIAENCQLLHDRDKFFFDLLKGINNYIALKKIRKFVDYSWRIAV